jgi:hypothetical protein
MRRFRAKRQGIGHRNLRHCHSTLICRAGMIDLIQVKAMIGP